MAWFKNRFVAAGEITTNKLSITPVIPELTAAAESGNAFSVAVQMVDPDGNDVARAVALKCSVYDPNGLLGVVGAYRLSESGAGTEVSTTAKPTLFVTTDANGACTLSVLDVVGDLTTVCYLVVEPLNTFGSPAKVTLDFN